MAWSRNRHLARAVIGRWLPRVPPAASVQGAAVRLARRGRRPLVSFKQDLFLLRRHQGDAGLGGKDVPLDDCGFEAGRDVTLPSTSLRWPQALRWQPVERFALALVRKARVKRTSVKQEENTVLMAVA